MLQIPESTPSINLGYLPSWSTLCERWMLSEEYFLLFFFTDDLNDQFLCMTVQYPHFIPAQIVISLRPNSPTLCFIMGFFSFPVCLMTGITKKCLSSHQHFVFHPLLHVLYFLFFFVSIYRDVRLSESPCNVLLFLFLLLLVQMMPV